MREEVYSEQRMLDAGGRTVTLTPALSRSRERGHSD
jgi:hypothetical protein